MFNYRRYSNSSESQKSAKFSPPSVVSTASSHGEIDDTCCCNLCGIFKCAPTIASISLTADVALIIASGETEISYALIPLFICSIAALALLMRGVRKERRVLVRIATFVALLKTAIATLLTVLALAVFLNYSEFYRLTNYIIQTRQFIVLFVGLSIILLLLLLQTFISFRAAEVIEQRDQLYIIPPSTTGKSSLRPSVKRALASYSLTRHNLGVEVF